MQVSIDKNTIFFRKKLAFVSIVASFSRNLNALGKGVSGVPPPAPGVFRNTETCVLNPIEWERTNNVFGRDDSEKKENAGRGSETAIRREDHGKRIEVYWGKRPIGTVRAGTICRDGARTRAEAFPRPRSEAAEPAPRRSRPRRRTVRRPGSRPRSGRGNLTPESSRGWCCGRP